MKLRGRLSYANVTSTLALCVALATGGAYAQSRIGTSEIRNRAVTGPKIQKNAIRGAVHVRNRTVPGRKIAEGTLNARAFSSIGGAEEPACDPEGVVFVECVATTLDLAKQGRAFIVATGANYSPADSATGRCEVRINGDPQPLAQFPGETPGSDSNTSASATSGFARTLVSPALSPGPVKFTLECNQAGAPDLKIDNPTIAAIALSHGRP